MKILVTCGLGYIGSHTVVELIDNGFEPIIVDNLSNSELSILDRIKKITGVKPPFHLIDLRNKRDTINLFNTTEIDGVIHFAAHKSVNESVEQSLIYYENNLTSLMNVLEGMEINKVKNLVFSSSCTVYGQPDVLPVTEQSPIKLPTSPYGNTKQVGEEIIQDHSLNKEFSAVLLRYFNPIGAHSTGLIGELPLGVPNNLVPYVTQTAAGIREELKIFGNDYDTPDGTAIRDYIDVTDLSKSHVVSLKRMIGLKNKEKVETFNVGTGRGVSVLELVQTFEKSCNINLRWSFAPRRVGDIEKIWADTTKANTILGWKSEKTLEETLKSAWLWQQNLKI